MKTSQCLDYNEFVFLAWNNYRKGDLSKMAENLSFSLDCSSLTFAESINDWIDQFRVLSAAENLNLDIFSLVNSSEWRELINFHVNKNYSHQNNYFPRVSIITSVYKGDKYIEHFLEDITRQTIFKECELILINPNSPGNEESIILDYKNKHQNIIYRKLEEDPGLYEVWNLGVRISRGEYLTNANLDDRRAPTHIEEHINALENNPEIDLVCAGLKPTREINETWENNTAYEAWYLEYPEFFGAADFFQVKQNLEVEQKEAIAPQNIPHCMPVWRKSIHDKNGYFDEEKGGASADWEFWLRCAINGSRYMLLRKPLGLYLEDPNSYNRRFKGTSEIENNIIQTHYSVATEQTRNINKYDKNTSGNYSPKFHLTSVLKNNYGQHRSGWSYAVRCLEPLHSDNGIFLDPFIEKKFAYGIDPGDINNNPYPYEKPWIGFIHCPPNAPKWFQPKLSPQVIFSTALWQESFKHCKGLYCLTENFRSWLVKQFDIPVESLIYPTETPELKFTMEAFLANPEPKIVQIGHWLRKLHSIYYLNTKKYKKIALFKEYAGPDFEAEKEVLKLSPDYSTVDLVNYLADDIYDDLLSKNIVYMELYDTCANTAIVECIVRNTPVLINPLPSVVEYLGKDYPLYFESRQEAVSKAEDFKIIEATYDYLQQHPIKEKLKKDYFLKSIVESDIYQNLP